MGNSTSSGRPLTVLSPVSDWTQDLTDRDKANDNLDNFNHPRLRRLLILHSLHDTRYPQISYETTKAADRLTIYELTHSAGLLQFLETAWLEWERLGEEGRDPIGWSPTWKEGQSKVPPLVPSNTPLPRVANQQPSAHVLGKVGYYCTDTCTPIFSELQRELYKDAGVLKKVIELLQEQHQQSTATYASTTPAPVIYALTTHPGHHAARDSMGGFCYVNHVATIAHQLQAQHLHQKVAILDVDYHCGNGTASIFAEDANVLVVSLHCHPDYDYPFHSGYADDTGSGAGKGTTLHCPMMPGTTWKDYQAVLNKACAKIRNFDATICLVSLGLDTHLEDPCTIRRAGFCLQGDDYSAMGRTIARNLPGLPLVILQEGGYCMEKVGEAAANVVIGCCLFAK